MIPYRVVLRKVLELLAPRTIEDLRKAEAIAEVQAINPPFRVAGWKGIVKIFENYAWAPWTVVIVPRERNEVEIAFLVPKSMIHSLRKGYVPSFYEVKELSKKELEELSTAILDLQDIQEGVALVKIRMPIEAMKDFLTGIVCEVSRIWRERLGKEMGPIPIVQVVCREDLSDKEKEWLRLSNALAQLANIVISGAQVSAVVLPVLADDRGNLIRNTYPPEVVTAALAPTGEWFYLEFPFNIYCVAIPVVDRELLDKALEALKKHGYVKTLFKKGIVRYSLEEALEAVPSIAKLKIVTESMARGEHELIKTHAGLYIPAEKKILVRKEAPSICVLVHEIAHAIDYEHERRPSTELRNSPLLMKEAKLLSLTMGIRDEAHLNKPTELWAQSVEAYVLARNWMKKHFPELFEFIDRWLNKIAPSLVRLSKELSLEPTPEAVMKLEELFEKIPKELIPILLKPLNKLTDREKEMLLRWGLQRFGKQFLEDVARWDPLAKTTIQWFETPLRVDIPGVDTPDVLQKARYLEKKISKVIELNA